jgi:multidrug transporter EmrE-like cation transporter
MKEMATLILSGIALVIACIGMRTSESKAEHILWIVLAIFQAINFFRIYFVYFI